MLTPAPAEVFDTALTLTPRVDRYARITVRMSHYSVPARLIGGRVRVSLGAAELVVFDGRTEVARHPRSVAKGSQTLLLDHYLEVLVRKPGALPGATALAQARAAGTFTAAHDAYWAVARRAHGDAGGTRALVEVLLLHRHLAHAHVLAGITATLAAGSSNPDLVAIEARKAATAAATPESNHDTTSGHQQREQSPPQAGAKLLSLTPRRLAELPGGDRPLPSVAAYDQLLTLAADTTGTSP